MDPGLMRQKNLVVDKLRANDFVYGTATFEQLLIQPGSYIVYPDAPNSVNRFTSIQDAVNQALADGYGTLLTKKATIYVYPKTDGSAYTGPGNEINITSLISLIGQPVGSAVTSQVLIGSLLRITNSEPQQASFFNYSTVSNLYFQWSDDRPAVIFEGTSPLNNLAVIKLDNCIFQPLSPTLSLPIVRSIGPSQDLQMTGSFFFLGLNQDQYCIDHVDGGLMVLRECIVTARKFVRISGTITTPVSKLQLFRNEQNAEFELLGGDAEFCTLFVTCNFPTIEMSFNYVSGVTGLPASTQPIRFIHIDSAVTSASVLTQLNSLDLRPNSSATQLVYDIPNVVGVTVRKYDVTPATSVTAISAGNFVTGVVP